MRAISCCDGNSFGEHSLVLPVFFAKSKSSSETTLDPAYIGRISETDDEKATEELDHFKYEGARPMAMCVDKEPSK
jgi:hypothetical protein